MKNYLSKDYIQVFPISIFRPSDPYARVLTEDHILDLIRSVAPSDSFVITETYDTSVPFEFIINGYYVSVLDSTQFRGDNIYAHIIIDITSSTHPQIVGEEDNTNFSAVLFSDSTSLDAEDVPSTLIPDHYEHHCLHILVKNGSSYQIPLTSRKTIDGGYIE